MGQRPYTKQINLCLSLLREQEKKHILQVSTKKTSPIIGSFGILLNHFYLSDKMRSRESLILVEKDKAII